MPTKTFGFLYTMYKYSYICKITGNNIGEHVGFNKWHWCKEVGAVFENRHHSYKYNTRYEGEV